MIVSYSPEPVTWQIVTLSYWYCATAMELPATLSPPVAANSTSYAMAATIAAKSARCAFVEMLSTQCNPPLLLSRRPLRRNEAGSRPRRGDSTRFGRDRFADHRRAAVPQDPRRRRGGARLELFGEPLAEEEEAPEGPGPEDDDGEHALRSS